MRGSKAIVKWRREKAGLSQRDPATRGLTRLVVRPRISATEGLRGFEGWLQAGQIRVLCRFGAYGRTFRKREGDGKTPMGEMSLAFGYFRRERVARIRSLLPLAPLRGREGWCDDPLDRMYNRPVPADHGASHEHLVRGDRQYDIVLIGDYNFRPRIRGRGSAIFFHITAETRRGTEGCVAVAPEVMRKILPRLARRVRLVIF